MKAGAEEAWRRLWRAQGPAPSSFFSLGRHVNQIAEASDMRRLTVNVLSMSG